MLRIRSIKRFTSLGIGNELSTYDGVGTDFAGLREYTESDDARFIEWRSTARGQKINMKKFEATTSLQVALVTDLQVGSLFRYKDTKNKYELIRECSKAIYDSALRYGHNIEGWWRDAHEKIIRQKSRHIESLKHAHLGALESVSIEPFSIDTYLESLERSKVKNTLILIISDTLESINISRLGMLSKQNDIVLIHIYDQYEAHPQDDTILGDTRGSGLIPKSRMRKYTDVFRRRRKEIETSLLPYGGYVSLSTNDAMVEKLNAFFQNRK